MDSQASYMQSDQFVDVIPEDVTFIGLLKASEWSIVLQVTVRQLVCVMKVHRAIERCYAHPRDREINTFTCESSAYRRLKAKGLCQRHVVPDFYGVIEHMEPALWQPYLDIFLKDRLCPSAVLIEYIPGMRELDLSTYSPSRLAELKSILDEIHGAQVLHGDTYPRNMMVQENSERILWIDFDRAQTYSENKPLTARQQELIAEEKEWMDWFASALEEDYKEGKLSRAWSTYYSYV